jgi:uncharacterized membrane protein YgcG
MKFFACFILLLFLCRLNAQDVPCNEDNSLLFDGAKVLKSAERKKIKQRLNKLNDSLSIKIYFVFIDSLNGLEKEVFVKKIIEEWDILEDPKAKELLVLTSIAEKKIMIEATSAMRKNFSETAALDIMNNVLVPAAEKKEYNKGINKAIDEILKYVNGYYSGGAYSPNYDHSLDRKWYLLQSYDRISLILIIAMALVFNVIVYVKFLPKPLGIFLLYQTLWHLLGSLNIFFYTILIMKNLDADFSVYLFNLLFVLLQIFILIKSESMLVMKKFIKTSLILFVVSWFLTVTGIVYVNYSEIDYLQSFLPYIYYGFLFNFILFSLGLLILLERRNLKSKQT